MDTAGFSIGSAHFGSTRHPFRATLPRRVLRTLPHYEPEVAARIEVVAPEPRGFRISSQDLRDFLLAYTACLIAAMTFLG